MNKKFEDASRFLMDTYTRQALLIFKGRGTRVYDPDGKEYIDFVGGIAVNNLGHCHPNVTVAFQKQAQRLVHVSNLYYTEPQIELARVLVRHSFADKVFFCNSGTEANEAAIKLIRLYFHVQNSPGRTEIISMEGSFHGRTLGSLSATGQTAYHEGFGPLLPGFRHVPFNDLKAVEDAIGSNTAAILVEPIQGEGGVVQPSKDYLPGLRKLCDREGLLLVLDEVQTGIGRTGRLFAYEDSGVEPDIMTLAKGLGSGLPIGAMLAREPIAAAFSPGTHASTFGGNPLVCEAARATLETLLEEGFILDNCVRMGNYLRERLGGLREKHSCVVDVRGKGLLIGMELAIQGKPIVEECLKRGLLINCVAERVLRFTPALIILKEDIDLLIAGLDEILGERDL